MLRTFDTAERRSLRSGPRAATSVIEAEAVQATVDAEELGARKSIASWMR